MISATVFVIARLASAPRVMKWLRSKKGASGIVGAIIGIFVAMIIGVALVEPLAYDVATAASGNLSSFSTAVTLNNLVPLFFVMLILAAAIAEVIRRL